MSVSSVFFTSLGEREAIDWKGVYDSLSARLLNMTGDICHGARRSLVEGICAPSSPYKGLPVPQPCEQCANR